MSFQLWYNTQNAKILFREYGRNVQAMVEYALSIADYQKRSRVAQGIVQTMSELLPAQNKKTDEFQHKLWDHLHIMADLELDIDCPFPKPIPEEQQFKPRSMAYPRLHYKNRHYGNHVQLLIQHAINTPNGEQKTAMVRMIAHYMKMVHKNLHNEIASEETIRNDLRGISKGQLDIIFTEENTLVLELDPEAPKKKRKRKRSHSKSKQDFTNNTSNQQLNSNNNTNYAPPPTPSAQETSDNNSANGAGKRKRKRNRKKK
jgi:hypothetical protein